MAAREDIGVLIPEFHQYGYVTRDLQAKKEWYTKYMGLGPWRELEWNSDNARIEEVKGPFRFKIALAMMGNMEFELIEPVEGDLVYNEYLERNEYGGIHHMGVRVTDLDSMVKKFNDLGIYSVATGTHVARGVRIAYMDARPQADMIIEFMERGPIQFD